MAAELSITPSAYSKIERGVTDPSIGRLGQIAKILEVDITYFFEEPTQNQKIKDKDKNREYGFASKSDIEELVEVIRHIKEELALLKKEVKAKSIPVVKKKN